MPAEKSPEGFKWYTRPFVELTVDQLYSILQLRSEVFVIEQDCIYQDLDDLDQLGDHIMAFRNSTLLAYARVLPPGSRFSEVSVGRIVTSPSIRKSGLGKQLVERCIHHCRNGYPSSSIRISAQCYLEGFYETFGFQTASEIYQEDGIDHQEMLLEF